MPAIDWPETWRVWEPWVRLLVSGLAAGLVVALVNNALQDRREASKAKRDVETADRAARRREDELRRTLGAEVEENIQRIGPAVYGRLPGGDVIRSAWDAARGLPLSDDVFDALAIAYAEGDRLNRVLQARRWEQTDFRDELGVGPEVLQRWAVKAATRVGYEAYEAFRRARAKLRGESEPEPSLDPFATEDEKGDDPAT